MWLTGDQKFFYTGILKALLMEVWGAFELKIRKISAEDWRRETVMESNTRDSLNWNTLKQDQKFLLGP